MFTGIITHVGQVTEKTNNGVTIKTDTELIKKISKGTSVAVDGICLTVVSFTKDTFSIDFMPETAEKTNIQYITPDTLVNLELPATSETFLAGHIVQGHIDGTAAIRSIEMQDNSHLFSFTLSEGLNKYIVEKGSIAVNGISLTVIEVGNDYFTVGIIPHTWEKTMLHQANIGDIVNIEVDVLAKYIEKLLRRK
ncbi:MAG TPA: riboflavin synthase [Candidatus Saccharimonadales bacterium]|nr:riboflavin synthase [Candidatus Saccharimonadales bacterium]